MTRHLWRGAWIDDAEVERRLAELDATGHEPLARPLDPELVIEAAAQLAKALDNGAFAPTVQDGPHDGPELTALRDLANFLCPENLERTLNTELGQRPRLSGRLAGELAADHGIVEAWEPLGLLAHVLPANVDTAGPVSLIEGLLSGNANIVKTSSRRGLLTQRFAAELIAIEPRIAPYLIVLRFAASRRSWLRQMCRPADGVVVWGSQDAVDGVADLVPAGARLITWGPKISFGYLTAAAWRHRETLVALCDDICAMDQQACSSPQVIYLDTASQDVLWAAAAEIAAVLSEVDGTHPAPLPDMAEQAEITNIVLVARHEEHLGLTRVFSGVDGRWHVIAALDPALRASPLYRTIWVKPLPRAAIVSTLRPMRRYLQTVGVSTADGPPTDLLQTLIAAGAQRVTPVGSMHDSYPGEPHDGEYALRRYSRRISIRR